MANKREIIAGDHEKDSQSRLFGSSPPLRTCAAMSYVAQIKRRASHRTMLGWSWLSALGILVLFWFYLYSHGYGLGRLTGSPLNNMNTIRPRVVLPQGTYVGTTLLASYRFAKPIEAFRGVPYAQDTGGQNRFRPPQPLPESKGTFNAIAWPKACPAEGVVARNMSENCLNANIYRPAGLVDGDGYMRPEYDAEGDDAMEAGAKKDAAKRKPRLPVVVYVHGGGFNKGYGTERNMASFVAWAEAPMVAVNFNYRVGALGFLPSDVTAREGLLNLGLRDQQMLLGWVQDNIAAFGGDPDNVTIMGLSAGAHSIGHHIMYYARSSAKPPFVKAILESGATTARAVFYPTHPRHLVQFREFLIAAGVEGVPESEIFNHLRKLPLSTIVQASHVVWDKYHDSVTWPFQPVIDGANTLANSSQTGDLSSTTTPPLIPELPISSWASGTHLRIPIITGFNTNEGTAFVPADANTAAEFRAFFQTLIPSLTPTDLDQLEALYPDPVTQRDSPYRLVPEGAGLQWARLDTAYSHYAYICPVLQTAHYMSLAALAAHRDGASVSAPVYVYRYAATATHDAANHGDEAPAAAHDMWELRGRPGMRAVADDMHGRWASFVASAVASPNERGGSVAWPAFVSPFAGKDAGEGKIMVFGEGNDEMGGGWRKGRPAKVVRMTELEREACRFWWERIGLSQGLGVKEWAKKPVETNSRL
ncbi:Alpha/Beta hydrolase protein [Chaetomium tenue]|uniref:Alpha/Beta hydrolase protein n=1 Tax=Chaetomium tenue TaxID=1854479 RepID=A0ACB7PLT0_9PEZI|nr:Alpha/Beta hydrolase protein [Chaetomium globosum]